MVSVPGDIQFASTFQALTSHSKEADSCPNAMDDHAAHILAGVERVVSRDTEGDRDRLLAT